MHNRLSLVIVSSLLITVCNAAIAEPVNIPEIRTGIAVTTAIRPEGTTSGRDYVSYKKVTNINPSELVLSYENDGGLRASVIIPRKNILSGQSLGAGFGDRLAGRRKNSTAIALSRDVLRDIKAGNSRELYFAMENHWSKGIVSGFRKQTTKIIVDDGLQEIDVFLAEFRGELFDWSNISLGQKLVQMEILDFEDYPIILHFEFFKNGKKWFSVETVRLETGDPVQERFLRNLENNGRFTSYGITFDYDSAEINDRMKATLDGIAHVLKNNDSIKISVEGHTDSDGSNRYNQTLSERRAKAVVNYFLTAHRIDSSRLSPVGYGEERPIAENTSLLGRALNRRVDFVSF